MYCGEKTEQLVIDGVQVYKAWVDEIPVLYVEPEKPVEARKLVIFLTGLGGVKERLIRDLKDISDRGYVALAFDNYQHGERNPESAGIGQKVFSNLRRYGWPVLGQTVLDTERIIDWAISRLGVTEEIRMGGISMGGDITLAVAGIDRRLVKIAPIIATPDWMRPGMQGFSNPGELMDPGKPDAYARFFYDQLNPFTHLERYVNCPPMRLTLGAEDTHIPPENMERFKVELGKLAPEAAERIDFRYIHGPGAGHGDVMRRQGEWWSEMLDWWLA